MKTHYHTADVGGLEIFYCEAGDSFRPTVLLLHGYPDVRHMFRDLIPKRAGDFRLVTSDLPGFGMSEVLTRDRFDHTFEQLGNAIRAGRFTHTKEETIAAFDAITEDMEIIGADGVHVGTVDHLAKDRTKLKKTGSGKGHHKSLKMCWIWHGFAT